MSKNIIVVLIYHCHILLDLILPFVLYGSGSYSVTLKEERRLKMHGKRELRTFGGNRKMDKNEKKKS
jgi:hypothetical protein